MKDEDYVDDDVDDVLVFYEFGVGYVMEGLGIDKGYDGVDDGVDIDDDYKSSYCLVGLEQGYYCGNDCEDFFGEWNLLD